MEKILACTFKHANYTDLNEALGTVNILNDCESFELFQ